MIHPLQQNPHMRQVELVRRHLRQLMTERKHTSHRGFVGHKEALSLQPSALSFCLQTINLEEKIRRAVDLGESMGWFGDS
jgi:hypothetical protein